jgi:hypothetical protein
MGGMTSALLVGRSLLGLAALTAALEVFAIPLGPAKFPYAVHPLARFGPLRSLLTQLCRRSSRSDCLSWGLAPLGASGMRSPLATGLCLPGYVPPSGFLNLLTAFSSPYLAALFHAACTCGVLPSELSPSKEPFRLSTALALLSFSC